MAEYNPYRAPTSHVDDVGEEMGELAGRGTRLGAVLLDGLMFGVLGIIAAIAIPALGPNGSGAGVAVAIGVVGIGILALLIVNLVLLHRNGQTLGKKWLGIKITRTDGDRAGLGRIFFLRMLVPGLIGAIPLAGPIFSIVDPLFIFRESRRCLHDAIADTIVVRA